MILQLPQISPSSTNRGSLRMAMMWICTSSIRMEKNATMGTKTRAWVSAFWLETSSVGCQSEVETTRWHLVSPSEVKTWMGKMVNPPILASSVHTNFHPIKQCHFRPGYYSDQTQGLGPEVVSMAARQPGLYRIGVKYFSSGAMGASRGTVLIRQMSGGKPIGVPGFLVNGGNIW